MGLFAVYIHAAPNKKTYIGITGRPPEKRWKNGKGYYQNKHFAAAIKKYGWDSFKHAIVAEDLSKEQAEDMEKKLIRLYRSNDERYGYNNSTGGEDPARGSRWTDEQRKRRSDLYKGRKVSEETKEKISRARKGKPNGREGKKGILCPRSFIVEQVDEESGDVVATFYGYNEACRLTGYARTPIREAANGIRARAYGYKWRVKEETHDVTVR